MRKKATQSLAIYYPFPTARSQVQTCGEDDVAPDQLRTLLEAQPQLLVADGLAGGHELAQQLAQALHRADHGALEGRGHLGDLVEARAAAPGEGHGHEAWPEALGERHCVELRVLGAHERSDVFGGFSIKKEVFIVFCVSLTIFSQFV